MTAKEAVIWLKYITADIGKAEHRDLWHYEQTLMEIREMLEADAQQWIPCSNCARNADNGGLYPDGRTRCPIQEHYALLKDGYCHLAEPWKGEQE